MAMSYPHPLFQHEHRASASVDAFDLTGVEITEKQNLAPRIAGLVLQTVPHNKRRHETLQRPMLKTDSVTVAIEVPVYLTPEDIAYMQPELGCAIPLSSETTLTDHIDLLPVELWRTRDRVGPPNQGPTQSRKCPLYLKKHALSYCRPTERLAPNLADLAYASLELAALEYRARRGEIIILYKDETLLWRFALPRLGWWRRAQRYRLSTRPLSQSQIQRAETLKRQTWLHYRSWSRITHGVLLSVIGAVQ
jgi:hypothetical protein